MKRTFFKNAALVVALACPLFTSCYDDAWINDEIDRLDTKIEALEAKLNSEVSALQQLVSGLVTVKEVAEDEKTGVVTITLSDGQTIEVQPADGRTLVTYIEEDGVKYWASCGNDGKKTAILDADGERIPVDKATPQVKEENGIVYISFDRGETWTETGNVLFTGAEIVYTDMYPEEEENEYNQEMPLYVTITLADGSTFSVTLDGASTLVFGSPYLQAYTELFVPAGDVYGQLQVYQMGVSDIIYQVPAGWQVEEDEYYGEPVINIYAPTEEAIASGAAAAEGYVKALGVCEGGKAISTKLLVTTKAVENLGVQKDMLVIDVNQGSLNGFWYGISAAADFDADAVMAEVEAAQADGWWYEGPLMQEFNDMTAAVADVAPDAVYGEEYVVWVVPVVMNPVTGAEALGKVVTSSFVYMNVTVETVKNTFNAIDVKVDMQGVESYWVVFTNVEYTTWYDSIEDYALDNTVNSYWPEPSTPYEGAYEGDVVMFANSYEELIPGTDYVLCIIPAKASGSYTKGDVYVYEYSTSALQAGGAITLTAGDPVIDYTSIEVALTASAETSYIYVAWVETELLPTITDKAAYLLENGSMNPYQVRVANLKPNTSRTLLAMGVDLEGKYGEVYEETFTTEELSYNDITVTITPAETEEEGQVAFTLSADGDVTSYTYWIGAADEYYYETYMGGTAEGASEYMALNPLSWWLNSTTPDAATVSYSNPDFGVDYVVVAQAVVTDADGVSTYSKATVHQFKVEYPLGNYVNEDDPKWAEAKPVVTPLGVEAREFVEVTWTVVVPEGYTVVKSLCIDPEYLASQPSAKDKTVWLLTQTMFSDYYYGMYVDTDYATDEPLEQPYYSCHYASSGDIIYTVIKDAEGNHYQYYEYDPQITADGGFGV